MPQEVSRGTSDRGIAAAVVRDADSPGDGRQAGGGAVRLGHGPGIGVQPLRRLAATLGLLSLAVGLLYFLGIGPFDGGDAEGQPAGRRGGSRAVTVKTAAVRTADVESKLSYVGSLAARASVTIAPKTSGRAARLLVAVGDRVDEGQLLAHLGKEELAEELREAEASLRVAQANLKGREAELRNLRRRRQNVQVLARKDLVSREEAENIGTQVLSAESQVELAKAQLLQMEARRDNARIRLEHTEIRSPFAGYVSKRWVDRGALVSPSTPLFEVVDIDRVKVGVAVVEGDYRKVSLGQPVTVTVDAYPEKRFDGEITRMSPVLDPQTRAGEVEIELDNPDRALKPGMFARAVIVVERKRGVLVVPESAPVKTARGYGVFKLAAEGSRVKRVTVEPGLSADGWVEVTGDLETGDRVVTLGSSLLRDGQAVGVAGDGSRAGSDRPQRQGEGRRRGRRASERKGNG